MILSVVIVSYNVKFFLEQCLSSLKNAVEGSSLLSGQTEVFVVDNASSDGSLDFLTPLYPGVHFIQNKENNGFAKANNQGLSLCTGEFILFLNPDTILAEDSSDRCISFFRATPDAGAIGVHMVDGMGRYLKESKRGFPGAMASFFKMSGVAGLFPHSKKFAAYYMGHLSEDVSQAVDILSGAFMMVKKTVLDITGGFDERFFMYAEDIDLSWRIRQAGFQNYYFAGTTIIHFKGESTPKDIRHVKMFYSAMKLFVKKHFHKSGFSMQLFLMNTGMHFRQLLAYLFIPFHSNPKPDYPYPTFIHGKQEQQKKWKLALRDQDISIVETKSLAEQIIYCQWMNESWKSIIEEIQKNKEQCFFKFHGEGTHAAISSYSSRRQGKVYEL